MLRTLALLAVFIPPMTQANQREPYLYRMKEPVIRMGKPVIETQANPSQSTEAAYEYTFTAKPIYEPMKKSNEMIQKLMMTMQSLLRMEKKSVTETRKIKKVVPKVGVSWAYYDE